jgi:uncharacterized protein with PQ loop repeat
MGYLIVLHTGREVYVLHGILQNTMQIIRIENRGKAA